MVMWIMSDRAIPRSFRFMEGFGVHTFRLVNAEGKSTFVKFHWKPKLGLQSVVWNEASRSTAPTPTSTAATCGTPSTAGDFPEWELGLQLFDDDVRRRIRVRRARRDQAHPRRTGAGPARRAAGAGPAIRTTSSPRPSRSRSAPQNVVPGIDFTNDPLLQGRNFSYLDTQLKRLGGPNFTHLPDQRAQVPVRHFQQDGHMAMVDPKGRANYFFFLPPPREDHPLRSRADPRTSRARARFGRPRLLRNLRIADRTSPAPTVLPRPARGRRCSCDSPRLPESAARPTRPATFAGSPSNSTPTRATGTWSATTSRCSSSRTR